MCTMNKLQKQHKMCTKNVTDTVCRSKEKNFSTGSVVMPSKCTPITYSSNQTKQYFNEKKIVT